MPFNFPKFRTACFALLCSHPYAYNLYAIKISDSLIESSILINLDNIEEKLGSTIPSRRYSSSYVSNEDNATLSSEIDKNLDDSSGTTKVLPGLINDLSTVFSGIPIDSKIDGFDHSIHYLVSLSNNQNFSRDDLITMLKSSIQALIQSDINDGQNDISATIGDIPKRLIENLFLDPPLSLLKTDESSSGFIYEIGRIYMESVVELSNSDSKTENIELASKSFMEEVFNLMDNPGAPDDLNDFYPGITEVPDTADQDNDVMKFSGEHPSHFKFDPAKTRIFSQASEGLAKGVDSFKLVEPAKPRSLGEKTFEPNLANSILKPILDNVLSRAGDNRLFAYELTKVISTSITQVITNEGIGSDEVDGFAETISKDLAEVAIQSGIDNPQSLTEFGRNLGQLAESVGVGTSMGVQLAAVDDKILQYESGFEEYSRKNLAKASSRGTSSGAIIASAESAIITEDEGDPAVKTEDMKQIASHAAMGSIIGHTAMSIYYPTPKDLLSIINYSAQGASLGSTTVLVLNSVENTEGLTESPTVEIARGSAHGATLGASFETIAITGSDPVDKSYDRETIASIQAASYGSTYGVILGATEGGESDSVILKQAAKQGGTEGALAGSGLATLYDEDYFNSEENFGGANGNANGNGGGQPTGSYDSVALSSKKSIIDAISTVNSQAAVDASSKLATKSIKTSAKDMIRLIQKFNISPRFTNPTRIFQGNKNQKLGDDFPFKDQFPVASPI
jgi:hypothetical protein